MFDIQYDDEGNIACTGRLDAAQCEKGQAFMDEITWEEEDRLWRRILNDANVNLTPGSACHVGEPGFMRICFATEQPEIVESAIERIGLVLTSDRSSAT